MVKNKLIIAAAGAGKTTFLVNMALDQIAEDPNRRILITTFTRSNAQQIREKIIQENIRRGGVLLALSNIVVQEWITFLLKEGVRPYKAIMHESLKYKNIGLYHDFQYNNNIYIKESEILRHYFLNYKILPNVISKFIVKANEMTEDAVIKRIENIYDSIFVDEVQDLTGYDLEIIKIMLYSRTSVVLVGDPRQVTYSTHFEKMNSKYNNGGIKKYILDKCETAEVVIDEESLGKSHRNNQRLCDFSSKLYPEYMETSSCVCAECFHNDSHTGVFLVRGEDIDSYVEKYKANYLGVLRWQKAVHPEKNYGDSKGLTFDRVLVYPTGTIIEYIKTGELYKIQKIKGELVERPAFDIAKFYVAVTRARHSVAIVVDYKNEDIFIEGIQKYK